MTQPETTPFHIRADLFETRLKENIKLLERMYEIRLDLSGYDFEAWLWDAKDSKLLKQIGDPTNDL